MVGFQRTVNLFDAPAHKAVVAYLEARSDVLEDDPLYRSTGLLLTDLRTRAQGTGGDGA